MNAQNNIIKYLRQPLEILQTQNRLEFIPTYLFPVTVNRETTCFGGILACHQLLLDADNFHSLLS